MNFLLIVCLFISILIIHDAFDWDPEALSLPIESVDLVIILVVESFLREIFLVAIHYNNIM